MKTQYFANTPLVMSPLRLFIYAQAFHFSSGRGRCFSPGFKALCHWQWSNLKLFFYEKLSPKWWRYWLSR